MLHYATKNRLKRFFRFFGLLCISPFAKSNTDTGIPILCYHSVQDKAQSPYSVATGKFWRQMAFLKKNGYSTVTLKHLVAHLRGDTGAVRERSVVLSFDDGFTDFDVHVLPVLKHYGFSGVLSIVTDFCTNEAVRRENGMIESRALSWSQVRHVAASGVEIASHGRSHYPVTSMSLDVAQSEIQQSKRTIESELQRRVDFFCYPHGAWNAQIADLVEQTGYKAAMTTGVGLVRKGDNPFRLRRVTMKRDFSLIEFRLMVTPAVEWYAGLMWGKIGQVVGLTKIDIF
jgi:peptidoglycan/xylan/chitin deacetylase (PgdA/CDA1 family)